MKNLTIQESIKASLAELQKSMDGRVATTRCMIIENGKHDDRLEEFLLDPSELVRKAAKERLDELCMETNGNDSK